MEVEKDRILKENSAGTTVVLSGVRAEGNVAQGLLSNEPEGGFVAAIMEPSVRRLFIQRYVMIKGRSVFLVRSTDIESSIIFNNSRIKDHRLPRPCEDQV